MAKRFIFGLENENLENTEIGTNTDPAEVITEGEAEIKNIEAELGEVSMEGARLFMAKEALDELIETTQDITEPTPTELSLIQSNVNNIARINDDAVIDVMPLAENVVSVESYGKGRGLLALEDAKKTMWERIKAWFAKFIAWVKEKAKVIVGFFTGTKKEAEDLKEQVKANDSSGKVTIEKPQITLIKNEATGKTTKVTVADFSDDYAEIFKTMNNHARKFFEEAMHDAHRAFDGADKGVLLEAYNGVIRQSIEFEKDINEVLLKVGAMIKKTNSSIDGNTSANEDHPEIPGIEVTYEESDTPITVNGIEVCEVIIESVKKQEEMAKILEKTSEKINGLLKKAEGKFEGKEADMVASIIRSLSANVSTLAVKVPSKLVMIQKRQLKEIRRGLAAA